MPSELVHQRTIIKDAIADNPNTFAIKNTHRFMSGLPDLLIKHPELDFPAYIEVKKGVLNNTDRNLKVTTTTLQRQTMIKMRKSGLKVAVWVVLEYGSRLFRLAAVPPECTMVHIENLDVLPTRSPGHPWPIKSILQQQNWGN
jgi:hypothetical protein